MQWKLEGAKTPRTLIAQWFGSPQDSPMLRTSRSPCPPDRVADNRHLPQITSTRLNLRVWWAQGAQCTSPKGWETPPPPRWGAVNTAQRSSLVACLREPTARITWAQHSSSEMLRVTYSTVEECWHSLDILSFDQEKCLIILYSHTCQ